MMKLIKKSEKSKDTFGKRFEFVEYILNGVDFYFDGGLHLEAILRSRGNKPTTKTRRKVKTEIFTLPREDWVIPWIKHIERDYHREGVFLR